MKHTIKLLTVAITLVTILTLTGCPGPVTPDNPCTHENKKTVTETAATCTETGLEKIICADCGELIEENTIEALGHDFGDEWTVTTAATCTADGEETRTCKREGCKHFETRTIKAHHSYGNWTVTKEAKCTEKGSKKHTCTRCGEEETVEIDALGHDYQGGYCERKGCTAPWQYASHITIKVFTSESYFRTFYGLVNRLTTNSSNKEQTYKEVNFSFNSTPNMTANELIQLKNDYANYQVKLYYYSGSGWSDNDSIDITNDLLGVLIEPITN